MDNDHDRLEELLADFPEDSVLEAEDVLICECHVVSLYYLRDVARDLGTVELKLLQEKTGIGTGCGSCLKSANHWLKKLKDIL